MNNPEKKENNDVGQKRHKYKNETLKEAMEDKTQSLRGTVGRVSEKGCAMLWLEGPGINEGNWMPGR